MSSNNTTDKTNKKFYAVVNYLNYRKDVQFKIESIHLNVEIAKKEAYKLFSRFLNSYDEIKNVVKDPYVECANKNIILYTTAGDCKNVYAVVELDFNIFMP